MSDERTYPSLRHVVLDITDARGLAESYRQLLGLEHRPGDGRCTSTAPSGAATSCIFVG